MRAAIEREVNGFSWPQRSKHICPRQPAQVSRIVPVWELSYA
jgi:hypothetical protein